MTYDIKQIISILPENEKREILDLLEKNITKSRKFPRKFSIIPVECDYGDKKSINFAFDISLGGLFIEVTDPDIKIGDSMNLKFPTLEKKKSLSLIAKVVWKNKSGVGLCFEEISEEYLKKLKEFFEEL